MLNKNDIIKVFRKDEFNSIPQDRLTDVIQKIYPHEEDILKSWEEHFQSQNIPYAIANMTHIDGKTVTKSLWKEKVVD